MNTTWHSHRDRGVTVRSAPRLLSVRVWVRWLAGCAKAVRGACLRASTAKTAKRRDLELCLHRPRFPSLV